LIATDAEEKCIHAKCSWKS